MTIREPAVAGRFYPGNTRQLTEELETFITKTKTKKDIRGMVVPHAGYIYSGAVAGAVYSTVRIPDLVVILCPNHTGLGAPLSIMNDGQWQTPLGNVSIDEKAANIILQLCPELRPDKTAHRLEHSLEVQLPFLQYLKEDFKLVPICVGTSNLDTLLRLGDALAQAIQAIAGPVLLVASSDMTHYESAAVASKKDNLAIEQMIALDPPGLHRVVQQHRISMCGFAPAVAVMHSCKKLGATKGELVKYANSGDVSGDYDSVLGYAGMIFY
jgi:AmmeMemoRadiSam system protein B